jgi:hypothetical protein
MAAAVSLIRTPPGSYLPGRALGVEKILLDVVDRF